MPHPVLHLNDGFDATSADLRDAVKELQTRLRAAGFSVAVDGRFGQETDRAVKQFQRAHGLDDDGVVGPNTWAALLGGDSPGRAAVLATTFPQNDPALLRQLGEAMKYKVFVEEGAGRFGFPSSVIGGVGSRESHWGLRLNPPGATGTGDFAGRKFPTRFRDGPLPPDGGGFGRGLLQIDYDAQEFARTGNWKDPQENILFGCKVLADGRDLIQQRTNLDGQALLRAALAGYNAGPLTVVRALRNGEDVDTPTTGRNYSQDVLDRAGWFQVHGWT